MEGRNVILLVGSLIVLNMLTQALAQSRYEGQSYLERYGPGSSSNTNRDRYGNRPGSPNRGPSRGGSSYGGSRRPSGGRGPSCPRTLNEWEYDMEGCMGSLNRLSKQSSMRARCSAFRDAEPCVDNLIKSCKINNPQIQYYKSKSLQTWTAMEREADVYGICYDVQ